MAETVDPAAVLDPAAVPCPQAAPPTAVYIVGNKDISLPSELPSVVTPFGSVVTKLPVGATDSPLRFLVHLIEVLTFRGF